jgi:hypothetical protein
MELYGYIPLLEVKVLKCSKICNVLVHNKGDKIGDKNNKMMINMM